MNKECVIILAVLGFVFGTSTERLWADYKLNHNKSYNTIEEEQLRFGIFKDNVQEINDHNEKYKKGLATYEMGINKFADLTVTEYSTIYKMFPKKTFTYNNTNVLPQINEIEHGEMKTTSEYFDWREKGAVTPVKNQGTCGSCWIFSAVGVLEAFYFKKFNKLISFSEQNIMDCISNTSNTCMGGWPSFVFAYVKEHGIVTEEEYPYQEKQGQCRQNKKNIKLHFDKVVDLDTNETVLKETVRNVGPVIVCIYASSKWRFYKSGVWYENECSVHPNHAMVLVGYGNENGVDYWLLKNSMGKNWGENGYIKIARNKHHNYCGITENVIYIA